MAERNDRKDASPELTLTRQIAAPRGLVFQVWTDKDHLVHWFHPKDCTTTFCEADVRVGGKYRVAFRTPDGDEHTMHGEFREVVVPERLVFTFEWENDAEPANLVTVTFTERVGNTQVTFHQAPFSSPKSRDSHADGWGQVLVNLESYAAMVQGED
jgi:uncharacterized protein YndB with AHSA1/START domain